MSGHIIERGRYRFDKRIMLFGAIGLNIVLALLVYQSYFIQPIYFQCLPENTIPCRNPFYEPGFNIDTGFCKLKGNNAKLCSPLTLQPGEYLGDPPNFLARNSDVLASLPIVLAFLVNHLVYNWRFIPWKK